MKTIIQNTVSGFRLIVDGKSRAQIVKELHEAGQDIGKTYVGELLAGTRATAKGFVIKQIEDVVVATTEAKQRGRKQKNSTLTVVDAEQVKNLKKAVREVAELIVAGSTTVDSVTAAMIPLREGWDRVHTLNTMLYLQRRGIAVIVGKQTYNTAASEA